MTKKNQTVTLSADSYYIVETPKKISITDSLQKAESKAEAFKKLYGMDIKVKVFEQLSLTSFVKSKFKEKPIFIDFSKECV